MIEIQQRYFNEIMALQQIKHYIKEPNGNLLQYVDNFDDQDNFYLVTEFCNGGNLFELTNSIIQIKDAQRKDRMMGLVFETVEQISNALYGLSNICIDGKDKWLVHKDIKMDNIFVKIGKTEEEWQQVLTKEEI